MTKLTAQHARDMGATLDRLKAFPSISAESVRRMDRLHADALIEDAERASIAGAADFVALPYWGHHTDAELSSLISITELHIERMEMRKQMSELAHSELSILRRDSAAIKAELERRVGEPTTNTDRPHVELTDAELDRQLELTRQAPMPKLRRELDAEDKLRRFEDTLRRELSNLSADAIGHMLSLAELIDKTQQVIIAVNILEDELSYRGRPVRAGLAEHREQLDPAPPAQQWPAVGDGFLL